MFKFDMNLKLGLNFEINLGNQPQNQLRFLSFTRSFD